MRFEKGNIPWNKGKKINVGKHLSKKQKQVLSKFRKGKKWEELVGVETAEIMRKKRSKAWSGRNNPHWRGGRYINIKGYVFVFKPDHPFADCRGYVQRSRIVMEKHLGRYLNPEEIVHHKNAIKGDDRIENFKLFPNKSKHTKHHRPKIGSRFQSIIT